MTSDLQRGSNAISSGSRMVLCFALLLALFPRESAAQIGGTVPRPTYYLAKHALYEGDYRTAEEGFARSLKSGIRIGQARWIDSICSYSMLGEVNFYRGNLARSLEFHELAIQVHLANAGWMSRLRYPVIGPSGDRIQAMISWGQRPVVMGDFPDSMSSLEGSFDLQTPFEVGGAVNPAHTRSVDAVEVFRCLAVSLRRRAEILGPTAGLSPMSSRLANNFAAIGAPLGHWVGAWVDVLYGLSQLGEGKKKEAMAHLARGVTSTNLDHPLAGIALLEIGKLHLRAEEYDLAIGRLLQGSLAAARYRQADIVEEAFRYLTDAFLANDGKGIHPPIALAIVYANHERFFRLAAALQLGAAELAVYSNAPLDAGGWLSQARIILARQRLLLTDIGSRLNYLDAITFYRAGNSANAAKSMMLALAYTQRSSLSQFHLTLVEALHASGRKAVSARNAEILYSIVLREPTDVDWRTDPLETITMLLSTRTGAIERWFELLVDRKEYDKAVQIAEHLRRHRFYSTLPFGGRILSLRWLVEGDAAMLGKSGLEQQKHLRTKYPALAELSRDAEKLRLKLREQKLILEEEELQKSQAMLLNDLASTSNRLENIIHEIALRREPANLVFPPQPTLIAIKKAMRDDQAVLMFVTTSQGWHAWFIRKGNDEYWPIRSPAAVRRAITNLLKSIGNRGPNYAVPTADLAESDWKQTAKQLWMGIIGQLPSNGWDDLDELVIIPDGVLWYLPFELLQVPADQVADSDEDVALMTRTRIRYAPVAALSVGDQKGHYKDLKTTIVGGQLFPRESNVYAGEMLGKLKESFPDLEVIGRQKPSSSSRLTAGLMDRLIVWNDVGVSAKSPYGWAPAQYDRKSKNGLLSAWMEYPWGAPDQLIVPGFHTAAESNLSAKATGYEVFLTAYALMASGTRTALLSRWRTGGKAPSILVREFATELPHASASDAWRTAIEMLQVEKLDAKAEPRLKMSRDLQEVSAGHPFFWAGYVLLDTGAEPEEPVEAAEGQANQEEVAAGNQAAVNEAENNPPDDAEKANAVEDQPLGEEPAIDEVIEEDEAI